MYLLERLNFQTTQVKIIAHSLAAISYALVPFFSVWMNNSAGKLKIMFIGKFTVAIGLVGLLYCVTNNDYFGIILSCVALTLMNVGGAMHRSAYMAFLSDQFLAPYETHQYQRYQSLNFFLTRTFGVIVTISATLMRSKQNCYTKLTCYAYAFVVGFSIYILAICEY